MSQVIFFSNCAWSLQQWKKAQLFQIAAKVGVCIITLSLSTTTSVKKVKKSDSCPVKKKSDLLLPKYFV